MFVCFCIFQLQTMADQLLSSRFGTRTSRAVAYAVQTLCKALWAFYDLSSGKKQFCCPLLLEMHLSNPWNNIMLSNKTWIPLWYTVNKDYTFKVTASNRQVTHNIKEIWSSLLPHMIMWIGFKNGTNHLFKNASNSHWLIRPFFVHEKIGLLCFVLFFFRFFNIMWSKLVVGKSPISNRIQRKNIQLWPTAFCFSERLHLCLKGRCCSNNIWLYNACE